MRLAKQGYDYIMVEYNSPPPEKASQIQEIPRIRDIQSSVN